MKDKKWEEGNRAFYWTVGYKHPLCLKSREHNREMKGVTWVYYSKKDARKLLRFLKDVFEEAK